MTASHSLGLPALDAWRSGTGRILFLAPEKRTTHDGPLFLLGGSRNYAHWVIDYLPRLAGLAEARSGATAPDLLMNDRPATFQTESLAALEIDTARPVGIAEDAAIACRPLFLHEPPRHMRRIAPWAPKWLRQSFEPLTSGKGRERVYISRSDARIRRIVNEPELIDALRGLDFDIVVPGSLGFLDQVSRFTKAEIIIGLHGAGMANIAFAAPGTRVLEILPARDVQDLNPSMATIHDLAHAAELLYTPIFGAPLDGSHPIAKERDIRVDIPAVIAAISGKQKP